MTSCWQAKAYYVLLSRQEQALRPKLDTTTVTLMVPVSKSLKVALIQKVLLHLSFLHTGKAYYFSELEFLISQKLKSYQKRALCSSEGFK